MENNKSKAEIFNMRIYESISVKQTKYNLRIMLQKYTFCHLFILYNLVLILENRFKWLKTGMKNKKMERKPSIQ